MKESSFKLAKQSHQTNQKLLKSLSSKLINNYPHIAVLKKANLKPQIQKHYNQIPSSLTSKLQDNHSSRNKSDSNAYLFFSNNQSMQKEKEKKCKNKFAPININQVQEIKPKTNNNHRALSITIKKKNSSLIEIHEKDITQKDNDQLSILRNILGSNSKHSTNSTSLYSDFKSYQKNNCIKANIEEREEFIPKILSKSIYSDISGYKSKENAAVKLMNNIQPVSSLNLYQKQGNSVLSRNKICSNVSIDLSSKRNKTNCYSSLNDSCGITVSSCNILYQKNSECLNNKVQAETAEEVHFKLVEIFQQKKMFYMQLSNQQNNYEAEEIANCYLEKD